MASIGTPEFLSAVKAATDATPQPDSPAEITLDGGGLQQVRASQWPMPLVCDVPRLHADAPAFLAEDGTVVVPSCPFCGERRRRVPARDGRWGGEILAQSMLIYAGMVLADGLCTETQPQKR